MAISIPFGESEGLRTTGRVAPRKPAAASGPDFRGQGLSTLLYEARHALVRRLGLRGHVAGGMPRGFAGQAGRMSIEAYVSAVVRGELQDPVLTVQLRRGYHPYGIITGYLDDPSCGGYGVFIVWRNPDRPPDDGR
jgi:hypothetical protein